MGLQLSCHADSLSLQLGRCRPCAARHAAADLFNIKHPSFPDEREVRISRMLVRAEDGSFSDVGGHRADGSETPPLTVAKRIGAFGETNYVSLPLTRADGTSAITE